MVQISTMRIIVEDMEYHNNHLPGGNFDFSPEIFRRIGKTRNNKYFTELLFVLKNTKEKPFPIDITLKIKGIFDCESISKDEKEIEKFLEIDATNLLYPYLRSTITTITSASLVPPIVLPVIDALTIIPEDEKPQSL